MRSLPISRNSNRGIQALAVCLFNHEEKQYNHKLLNDILRESETTFLEKLRDEISIIFMSFDY